MRAPARHWRAVLSWSVALVSLDGVASTANGQSSSLPPPPQLEPSRRLFESWKAPITPRHLVANIYYVGAVGVSSFLITSPAGHFLLDTGFADTVPIIQRGVQDLGFRLSDIKYILSSHAHNDHVGGHAKLQQLTGGTIVASAEDARLLAAGGANDYSPFPAELMRYTPVPAGRIVHDRETLTLGAVTMTAHLTPGHTRGATTWTLRISEKGQSYDVVFFSSTSVVDGTRLLHEPAYPTIVADYEATWTRLKSLPCDIWFAPHGGQFAMVQKLERLELGAGSNPFIDPSGWKAVIAKGESDYRRQLEAERTAGRP